MQRHRTKHVYRLELVLRTNGDPSFLHAHEEGRCRYCKPETIKMILAPQPTQDNLMVWWKQYRYRLWRCREIWQNINLERT